MVKNFKIKFYHGKRDGEIEIFEEGEKMPISIAYFEATNKSKNLMYDIYNFIDKYTIKKLYDISPRRDIRLIDFDALGYLLKNLLIDYKKYNQVMHINENYIKNNLFFI